MEKIYQELKVSYQNRNVVLEKKLDLVLTTIMFFAKGLSKLTKIDPSYFIEIMKMRPLIPYHDDYKETHIKSVDLLNSFEAICDCGNSLKLEFRTIKDFKRKVGWLL
ncbi:MAG: hypothetical protein HFJ12_07540 [Bacilli bacterium]|nr:hypothetical protein [Bacilli bacterium]